MSQVSESSSSLGTRQLSRRTFTACLSGLGLSSTLLPETLWAQVQEKQAPKITKEMLQQAEQLAGLEFTDQERDLMLDGLNNYIDTYKKLRTVVLDNSVAPALRFDPVPGGMEFDRQRRPMRISQGRELEVPTNLEEVAFWPVADLAGLIKSRKVSSVELTNMYLARLKRYDPKLQCVITLTEELAREQAKRADEEIAAGPLPGATARNSVGSQRPFGRQGIQNHLGRDAL